MTSCGDRLSKEFFHNLKACLLSRSNNDNTIMILTYHARFNTRKTRGRILSTWLKCIGLLKDNMIVLVTVFQIFNSIKLGAANLTEVWNWQAVTHNLGLGLLLDIFRIFDFFWKLGRWNYNRAWDYTRLTTVHVYECISSFL